MISDVLAIQKIVDEAVGVERFAYPAQKNATRPKGDYAVVTKGDEVAPGFDKTDYYINSTGEVIMRVVGLRVVDFEIMFSRDDEELLRFDQGLYSPRLLSVFSKYNFVVMKKQRITNETKTLETNWEVRAGVKLVCNVLRKYEESLGVIETAPINGYIHIDGKIIPITTE